MIQTTLKRTQTYFKHLFSFVKLIEGSQDSDDMVACDSDHDANEFVDDDEYFAMESLTRRTSRSALS